MTWMAINPKNTTKDDMDIRQIYPGEFVSETLVTDTVVYEVIKTTACTMTLRATMPGNTVEQDNMISYRQALPDTNGKTYTVKRRANGQFKMRNNHNPLRVAHRINGVPVSKVNYGF